ncbi:MAG: hypothetical protein JW768_03930 [Chitinispirillaceae bacterium]|nr:hypothetical protein [Chitinispirillaceae bacterium]
MTGHTVTLIFQGDLARFLPFRNRPGPTKKQFPRTSTIKDIIESLGIPHTEIDVILVRNQSVDFSYRPCNHDVIMVYPPLLEFDTPVLHLFPPLPALIRFIGDVHIGKLCRVLRLCGFDTLYRIDYNDTTIIDMAVSEQRIVLTRDRGILKHAVLRYGYCIRSDAWREQAHEVVKRFSLSPLIRPFTICPVCNGPLYRTDKTAILHLLEEKTKRYYDQFTRCRTCGKMYWEGSHFRSLVALTNELQRM